MCGILFPYLTFIQNTAIYITGATLSFYCLQLNSKVFWHINIILSENTGCKKMARKVGTDNISTYSTYNMTSNLEQNIKWWKHLVKYITKCQFIAEKNTVSDNSITISIWWRLWGNNTPLFLYFALFLLHWTALENSIVFHGRIKLSPSDFSSLSHFKSWFYIFQHLGISFRLHVRMPVRTQWSRNSQKYANT